VKLCCITFRGKVIAIFKRLFLSIIILLFLLVAADPRSPSQLRFFDLGHISRNFLLLSRKQKKVPKIPFGNSNPYRAANADPKVFLW
jgi:hypothetical protein